MRDVYADPDQGKDELGQAIQQAIEKITGVVKPHLRK